MSDESQMPFDARGPLKGTRWIAIATVFALGFLLLWGSLVWHQLLQSEQYRSREVYQTYRRIIQEGPRGNIYDRNGILLATNQPVFKVGVYLNELRGAFRERFRELQQLPDGALEPDTSLTWLARRQVMQEKLDLVSRITGRQLELDTTRFENHFRRRLILPFEILNHVSPDEYAKLVEQLPPESPLQLLSEPVRFYPFGSVASHVIGHVGRGEPQPVEVDAGSFEGIRMLNLQRQEGKAGLERSLDAQLRGKLGWEVWSIDPLGFQVNRVDSLAPRQGTDLYTTLDLDLQMVGEAAMQGKKGAIAAILVDSGEILAMVSQPSYDLNLFTPFLRQSTFDEITESQAWMNRAIQGLYPPGSTFKVVTALAALNDPSFDPNLEVYCGPFYTVGDRRFPENRSRGYGFMRLTNSLAVSSNVYFYQLGLRTGIDAISRQSKLLGLGAPTGVELPFEARNSLVPSRQWKQESGRGSWLQGDTANVSIGQGDLLVTPLQMARLTAAVASRREYMPVTLLRDKNTALFAPNPLSIQDRRFSYVIEGMRQCVESGTGRSMALPGVSIAAKTGTAQVFPGGVEENLAWVIAFAPVDKPRIAVAVVVESVESSDPIYGGITAGPIASKVIREFFEKYGM